MAHPVEIRTPRLTIRELASSDAARLLSLTSDPAVVRYLSFGPTSPAEAAALVDFALHSARATPRLDYVLAIVDPSGSLIGSCGFHADGCGPAEREVWFVLRRDAWGRGLGGEVLRALLDFGFVDLGLTRIHGIAHPGNAASIRVMERAGMTCDGPFVVSAEQSYHAPNAFENGSGWRAGRRYAILRP